MSGFFEDALEYRELVEVLRTLVTGSSEEVASTQNGTIPSFRKWMSDNLRAYVRAASDRKGVANKSILDANLNFDDGVLAEVTNDPVDENNGLYRKEGASGTGSWVKASQDRYTYLQQQFDDATLGFKQELEKLNIHQYDPSTKLADETGVEKVYSINDSLGFAALLIDAVGRLEINGMQFDRVDSGNPLEVFDEGGRLSLAIGKLGELITGDQSTSKVDDAYPWFVSDVFNRVSLAIGERGQVVLPGIEVEAVNDLPNYLFAIKDNNGQIAFGIDKKGRVQFEPVPSLIAKTSDETMALNGAVVPADDMQFFSYGQSLSRGATSYPVISTTQPFNNVTFNGGVLSRDGNSFDLTAYKPLIEENFGSEGETPTSGAVNEISARMGVDYYDNGFRFIGSAPGRGGRPIDQLNKGTEYYQYLIEHVQSAFNIAQLQGRSHNVQAMWWTQGEANSNNMTMDVYERKLVELHNDFSLDVQSITGQKFKPVFISYQVAAHRRYNSDYPEIALAQLNASNNHEQIYVACPMYFAEYNTDNLHLTAEGSRWLGKFYGKVYHKIVNEKQDWKPLQPKSITSQGKVIEVLFHLPEGGSLKFDTDWVAAAPNMGFDIFDEQRGAHLDLIGSVTITGPDRVRITLTSAPPSSARLTYAHGRFGDPNEANRLTGPRGNLRDNAGDNDHYTDDSGAERYMHNWCVMFDEALSN